MLAGEGERALEQAYVEWAYERLDAMVAGVAAPVPDVAADGGGHTALKQIRESRRNQLTAARDHERGLVIGRLDLVEGDTYYVGMCHVDGDGGDPAVVDWRTGVGERFYQASTTQALGIGRRRNFVMRRRHLESVDDELLVRGFRPPASGLDVAAPPDGIDLPAPPPRPGEEVTSPADVESAQAHGTQGPPLTAESEVGEIAVEAANAELRARDLLLAELEASRTGEMHDVVATIQADQDRLIRADPTVPLLIQGGPGTGKTVVGLHRAAWVLFEQRRHLGSESVLIVGPNPRFLDYIGGVLPALGESAARQITLDELGVSALPATQRDAVEVRATDSDAAARAKAGQGMASVIARAIRLQVRPQAVTVAHGLHKVELSEQEVAEAVARLFEGGQSYRSVQERFPGALASRCVQLFQERSVMRTGRSPLERERADFLDAAKQVLTVERRTILPTLEGARLVNRLLTEPDLLSAAAEGVLDARAQAAVLRTRGGQTQWTASDLPLIDEAHCQLVGQPTSYSHVVIDEAQDLSPMQWRMVLRRAQRASMTILGDLAQGTAPWSPTRWDQVLHACGLEDRAAVGQLAMGYRIPKPVSDFACRLLPETAPGLNAPTSFREGEEPSIEKINGSVGSATARVSRAVKSTVGTTAVIAPPRLADPLRQAIDGSSALAGRQVSVLEAPEAKGLEFDNVIVVEPAEIAGSTQRGLRAVFVALTRATKHLLILTSTELPGALRDASPAGVAPFRVGAPAECACGFKLEQEWRFCPACGVDVISGPGEELAAPSEPRSPGGASSLSVTPEMAADLVRWAERRRVGAHKSGGRADPEKCTCRDQACLKAQAVADIFAELAREHEPTLFGSTA